MCRYCMANSTSGLQNCLGSMWIPAKREERESDGGAVDAGVGATEGMVVGCGTILREEAKEGGGGGRRISVGCGGTSVSATSIKAAVGMIRRPTTTTCRLLSSPPSSLSNAAPRKQDIVGPEASPPDLSNAMNPHTTPWLFSSGWVRSSHSSLAFFFGVAPAGVFCAGDRGFDSQEGHRKH